jgi:predicted nucleic acid-binding protein
MNYLLDSNTVSELYDKFSAGYPKISQKLGSLTDDDQVYISILTLYELEYGWANASDEKKEVIRQKITEVQEDFEVLPLSAPGAKVFGELKKIIKDSRSPSKENMKKYNVDLMMAATAISINCILVSADTLYKDLRQFHQALQLTNWTV